MQHVYKLQSCNIYKATIMRHVYELQSCNMCTSYNHVTSPVGQVSILQ